MAPGNKLVPNKPNLSGRKRKKNDNYEQPNDMRVGKLCEYASKNPLRIPKENSVGSSNVLFHSHQCRRKDRFPIVLCNNFNQSLMHPSHQLLDHEKVIVSWALRRRRTRPQPQPQLLSKCRKLTLQWGNTHHRTTSRLHAQPRHSSTTILKKPPKHHFEQGFMSGAPKETQRQEVVKDVLTPSTGRPLRRQLEIGSTSNPPKRTPLQEVTNFVLAPSIRHPLRHQIEIGSTSRVPKPTPLQANMNHVVNLSTRHPTYTVFGYEDYHLQCTREHYQKKNIGIVIREESELKIMHKENQRKLKAKKKAKENQKGAYSKTQAPNLPVSWDDKAIEWKRVHSATSRGWRKVNKIFVTNNICWPWTLPMDSLSFQRFMYRRHGRA